MSLTSAQMSRSGRRRDRLPFLLVLALGCLLLMAPGLPTLMAQSGRRPVNRPVPAPAPPAPQPREAAENERPLADTTPVQIDESGTIKLDTSLVTIPVTVIDRQGRFVPDLRKQNFRLYEDNVEQQIDGFHSIDVPFNVVLMIDTSGSTRFRLEDIQEAAVSFVNQLKREDQVMVVSFATRHRIECEFTNDRDVLREAIYQTRTGGGTKLYNAVDSVLDLLEQVEGRKAVVLFTDGVDTLSRRASAISTVERAEESGVLFYPIKYDTSDSPGIQRRPGSSPGVPPIYIPNRNGWPFPGGRRRWPLQEPGPQRWNSQWPRGGRLPGQNAEYNTAHQYLSDLAEYSGGRLSEAGSLASVSSAFRLIAEELRQQYALSYYPSNTTQNGAWRQIRVRVDRSEYVVRSRKGYRAALAP
ncbi:MAG: VWA domain-containing protein [Acidobacteriota bacterium]